VLIFQFEFILDMDYEFLVRTADNVEIILDVSIFWQITDLYKLVLVTQDPPEDICKNLIIINSKNKDQFLSSSS